MVKFLLTGNAISIVDLALVSVIKQLKMEKELQPELAKWFANAENSLEVEKSSDIEVKKEAVANSKKKGGKKAGKEELLFDYFRANGIAFANVEHPEVFTVEAMMPHLTNVKGAVCKNLFLKDKKKNLYLLSAVHDKDIKLNDVAKAIGAKELRFADESVLLDKLGVTQGCVTAFALINDLGKDVKFVVDKSLLDGSYPSVNFHPLVNTATTNISCEDFNKFLSLTGHTVIKI